MLKPMRIFSQRDKKALWNIFEYRANEPDYVVKRYEADLQRLADMLDLTIKQYEKETQLPWNREYDQWEGFDD